MTNARADQGLAKHYRMFIDGEWVDSKREEMIEVVNPATERVIASVPKASREQAKAALEAAEAAQPRWEDLAPLQRAAFLFKTAQLIRRDKERLSRLLTSEQGKPLFEARGEIDGAASNFEYYAEFARRIEGDVLPSDNPHQTVMILRLPIGVVASITPWNFPSATVARKLAPALITGNTVVTKPSSNTPLSTIEMVRLMEEAGFPNGVVNVVTGSGSEVDEKIKDKFVSAFVRMAKDLRIGNPLDSDTDLGPMVSKEERETSVSFIENAKEEGDKIVLGGQKPSAPTKGWFLEPTVIKDVKQKSSLVQDEIFGPVVPILEVDSFDKAIDFANDSKYGLASYVFTKDSTRVLKAMNRIRFGESYINQVGPEQLQGAHTGFRQSGLGTEASRYGLEGYTQLKTCYVDWNDKPSLSYLFPYKSK